MKKTYIREKSLAWYVVKHKVAIVSLLTVGTIIAALQIGSAFAEPAEAAPEPVEVVEVATIEFESLGMFKVTHYCCEDYPHICNDGDATKTATGTVPTPGRTIAVDPNVIPYGTEVLIGDLSYIAEDCGGAIKGNRIDICVATHEEAEQLGTYTTEVFEVKEIG